MQFFWGFPIPYSGIFIAHSGIFTTHSAFQILRYSSKSKMTSISDGNVLILLHLHSVFRERGEGIRRYFRKLLRSMPDSPVDSPIGVVRAPRVFFCVLYVSQRATHMECG